MNVEEEMDKSLRNAFRMRPLRYGAVELPRSATTGAILEIMQKMADEIESLSTQLRYQHLNLVDACRRIEEAEDKTKALQEAASPFGRFER